MRFVVATKNKGKMQEIQSMLSPLGIDVMLAEDAGVFEDIEETGTTFEENAFIKARAVAKITGLPVIADDSGLMVDALSGEPGVKTARFAGENATDGENIQKLLNALEGALQEKRTARFQSVIACVFPDGREFCTQGICEGEIALFPMGEEGFGYDPVFYVKEKNKTFAQLSLEEKNALSHRGKALESLKERLKEF